METDSGFRRQGSLRRVTSTRGDSQLSMSAKLVDRPTGSAKPNDKIYTQCQLEYNIILEYNLLRKQEVPGIYVIPSARNSLKWFGVIFVRQGLYQGGIFRFTVSLPECFPDGGCPRIIFQSEIIHPLINPETNEFDLSSNFGEWKKNVNHIWQILNFMRRAFYKTDNKLVVNSEASHLFENNPEEFQKKVLHCVKKSQDRIYDPSDVDDPHYIAFEKYDDNIHGPIKDSILEAKENSHDQNSLGFSWIQPGSLQPFSKSHS